VSWDHCYCALESIAINVSNDVTYQGMEICQGIAVYVNSSIVWQSEMQIPVIYLSLKYIACGCSQRADLYKM